MLDEHPHRCRAGHQWHHAGLSADGCRLPTGCTESGEPRYTSTDECPLCSGRHELLMRGPHDHQCPVCVGAWRHEGVCPEGPMAWCPWCIPTSGERPVPGSRSGRHFHVCPRSARSWEHARACAAPLRAETADCSECRRAAWPARAARTIVPLGVVACLVFGLWLALRPSPRAPGRTLVGDRAVVVQISAASEALTPRATDGPMPARGANMSARAAVAAATPLRRERALSGEPASRRAAHETASRSSGARGFAPFIALLDAARPKRATAMPQDLNAARGPGARGFADTPVSER